MSIPDNLVYVQRRNDHRVPLVAKSQFCGYLELKEKKLVTGYAADISLHGLGIVLNTPESILQGNKISSCELQLNDETPIRFDMTICFVYKIPQSGNTRVGGQFEKLKNSDKSRIAKIIRALERKHAQMVRN
jgi:c-di-GMP-binding flagellar brake protein YcgR